MVIAFISKCAIVAGVLLFVLRRVDVGVQWRSFLDFCRSLNLGHVF